MGRVFIWGEGLDSHQGAQELLLALLSEVAPGKLRGTYGMPGCMQGKQPTNVLSLWFLSDLLTQAPGGRGTLGDGARS